MDALGGAGEGGDRPSADEIDGRIGRLVDERYTILEPIASGSMGVVYKAERVPVGKLVAIKFLHASFAREAEFLTRFERETRVMSKLSHPNCVSVVDFGVWEGAPYLVMELVPGRTLREIVDDGPIAPQRALLLTRQIAAGLAHAHAQGVVHRDIKPANIMISEEPGTGEHLRILDFGLARLRGNWGRDATQTNVVVGTPNYMAPEQTVGGMTIDARTDIYAVGCVLFEMITGQRPYAADDTLQLLGMHRAAPVPRLADRIEHTVILPEGVQAIIDRAMAKSPAQRYASAVELAEAIDAIVAPRITGEQTVLSPRNRVTGQAPLVGQGAPADAAVGSTLVDVGSANTRPGARDRAEAAPPRGPRIAPLVGAGVLAAGLAGAAVWYARQPRPAPPAAATPSVVSAAPPDAASVAPAIAVAPGGGSGDGGGSGLGSGDGSGLGSGDGSGLGSGDGSGDGSGLGSGLGSGDGSGLGSGDGSGDGSGLGSGDGSGPGSGDGSGSGSGSGGGSGDASAVALEEIEMDPMAADNPDPTAAATEADDEAADAPATTEDAEKRLPATAPDAPVRARTVREAVQLLKAGKRDEAFASLRALWRKAPDSAYIPFLLGNIYNDRLWWSIALDHYRVAIVKNGAYRGNPVLNRNVIRMLASPKTVAKATAFLKKTIGKPAIPYLRRAARTDKNKLVRARAGALIKQIR